jgi:hypothetical protein
MANNSFRFNTDTATAYLIREAALRQGRTVADVIRRAVEQHIDAHAASATADDCVVTDEGTRRRGPGRMTGCYLSNPLASIVRDIAAQEGRSHSNVVRGLIRDALRARGILPIPSPAPASAVVSPTT